MTALVLSGCNQNTEEDTPQETMEVVPEEGEVSEQEESSAGVTRDAFKTFTTENIAGERIDQEIFKGKKVTMINIWGTFCGPCVEEMPILGKLHEEYKDQDFQVVGLVVDVLDQDMKVDPGQLVKAEEVVAKTGAHYIHLLPSQELIENKLAYTQAIPETVFVDENGNQIGDKIVGAKDEAGWRAIIDEKLAEVQ